jgi:transcriptional regulator with XRE-family HTH domain
MNRSERNHKDFASWLKSHRRTLGINQTEAAKRAKMSRTQWARLELGECGTKRENVPLIAKAINADIAETYRRAGYASPIPDKLRLPGFIERYNALPANVQEDVTAIVDALWKKYLRPAGR